MSVLMAIVDFIPVFLFLTAAVVLQRELYSMMSKGAFAVFSAGTICVFVAGFFKALWKLLYAAGICDFAALSACFFPMQTTGWVLAAAGALAMLLHKQGKTTVCAAAAPAVFASSMPFVVLMVLGVGVLNGSMLVVAKRRGSRGAMALYVLAFFLIMAMGYLSSRNFSDPAMNWLAEGVNTLGQGSFLAASLLLKRKSA